MKPSGRFASGVFARELAVARGAAGVSVELAVPAQDNRQRRGPNGTYLDRA